MFLFCVAYLYSRAVHADKFSSNYKDKHTQIVMSKMSVKNRKNVVFCSEVHQNFLSGTCQDFYHEFILDRPLDFIRTENRLFWWVHLTIRL